MKTPSLSVPCDRAKRICGPGTVAEATKETAEARAKIDKYIAKTGAWLVERAQQSIFNVKTVVIQGVDRPCSGTLPTNEAV